MTMNKLKALLENGSKVKLTVDTKPAAPDTIVKLVEAPQVVKKSTVSPRRLTFAAFILSIVMAALAGYLAYQKHYIINSRFDRPVTIPGFEQPQYLPINLILIASAAFLSVWILYIVVRVILSLTSRSKTTHEVPRQIPQAGQTSAFAATRS